MPYKHNESKRHKFAKSEYKIENWDEYNEGSVMVSVACLVK